MHGQQSGVGVAESNGLITAWNHEGREVGMNIQTNRKTDKQTSKQTNKQTINRTNMKEEGREVTNKALYSYSSATCSSVPSPHNTALRCKMQRHTTCRILPPIVLQAVVEDWEQDYNRYVTERWLKFCYLFDC